MNFSPIPQPPYRKNTKSYLLKETAKDILKLIIIFVTVIIIGCIKANS